MHVGTHSERKGEDRVVDGGEVGGDPVVEPESGHVRHVPHQVPNPVAEQGGQHGEQGEEQGRPGGDVGDEQVVNVDPTLGG